MRRRIIVVALALFCEAAWPSAQRPYTVYGQGTDSCGEWRSARTSPAHQLHLIWVLGFMSGVGWAAPRGFRDVDNGAIDAWLDDYCASRPLAQLSTAAAALVNTLGK